MKPSSTPLFSVIIPVYNGEKYLTAAVQSVLQIGYEALELIVIDDGSTDGTAKAIDSFPDKIRYFSQPQKGPAAARNRGLQFARGDVVGFLDADDLWTPSISRALEVLISHPQLDIVQGRIQRIRAPVKRGPGLTLEYFLKPYPYINLGSAVYRRKVFAKVGIFDETMRFCEDYDWFLRAFDARIPKMRIDDVTMLCRIHSGSMTYGKTLHEIGMAKAHKKAIQRRRRDSMMKSKPPPNFPTLLEYIGTKADVIPSAVSDK